MSDMISVRVATLDFRPDGILAIDYDPGAYIDLDHSHAVLAALREHAPDRKVRILSRATGIKGASSEARAFGATEDFVAKVAAMAILAKSPVSRMVGNFFIRLTHPPYPTRLFDDEALAIAWLHER